MSPETASKPNSEAKSVKGEVLILLYSLNVKLRSILSAGLRQCSFRIIETDSDRMTTVKATQYRPALTIVDLGINPRNLKIISGLMKSTRTRNIPLVIIGNKAMSGAWNGVLKKLKANQGQSIGDHIKFAEFPFKFAGLLEPVNALLKSDARSFCSGPTGDEVDEDTEEMLFDSGKSNQAKLDIILRSLKKQWAFPYTVFQALKIADSDKSGTRDLGKCIKTDSASSSAILKIANTVFYAKSDGKFTDVIQAVVRLGFKETRNLLSSMALMNLSAGPDKTYGFSRTDFWLHALSTGVLAQSLAHKACPDMADIAFITALVHDLGKVPLDNNFTEVFPQILEKSTTEVIPFHKAEKSLLGFTHSDCGKYLMDNWNFPPAISEGVFNHHNSHAIITCRKKSQRIMQGCVFAANIFSKAMEFGHSTDECLPQIPQQILNDIKTPNGPTQEFFFKVQRELKVLVDYLKIADDDFKMEIDLENEREYTDIAVISDQKDFFHPMFLALKNNGYHAVPFQEVTEEVKNFSPVTIHFLKKGEPVEVSKNEDAENGKAGKKTLDIFMVHELSAGAPDLDDPEADTFYLSSKSSDFCTLKKLLDNFFD